MSGKGLILIHLNAVTDTAA